MSCKKLCQISSSPMALFYNIVLHKHVTPGGMRMSHRKWQGIQNVAQFQKLVATLLKINRATLADKHV